MNTNTAIVLVVALLVLLVAGFLWFRRRGKMKFTGPFKTQLEMEGSDESTKSSPGVRAVDVTRGAFPISGSCISLWDQ